MVEQKAPLLPLHRLLEGLDMWRSEPSGEARAEVAAALQPVLDAYDTTGAFLVVDAPNLPRLEVGAGSYRKFNAASALGAEERDLALENAPPGTARLWVEGSGESTEAFVAAMGLVLEAISSRQQVRVQRQQLEALDAAVRGIAAVQSVDTILQLIVDRVRELVSAQYAALGIVGPFGNIEQFVTSGITRERRERIGPLPRGHGLLGLIIRENRSFLIEDIATDLRRHGFPPHHPEMHSFLGAPVRSEGKTIGNLYLTNKLTAPTFSEADLRLVEMFALHAGIAMENARLHDQVQRLAVVDERQRISQDLHDSIIQSLYAISLSLEDLPELIAEDPAEGAARADRAIDGIHGTIRDIRNFIFGLQPELLETADLPEGIRSMAAEFRTNTLIDLDVEIADDLTRLPEEDAAHVLAMTREGLSNIAKHSRASQASIDLRAVDGLVLLTIGDNGAGFEPARARSTQHHGLANLRARAEAAGGSLRVDAAPGAGTRIVARIPLRTQT